MKKLNRVYQKIENDYKALKSAMLANDTNKVKPSIHVPDESISIDEMISYGYTWDGMLPLREDKAKKLMRRCTVYQLYRDNTEAVVTTVNSLLDHAERGGIFGVDRKE